MKATLHKRLLPNKLIDKPDFKLLKELAAKVKYVGSPEHKDASNPLISPNNPKPRANSAICPRSIRDIKVVNAWLRQAFEKGVVSEEWEGNYPRHVWFYDRQLKSAYIGRLTNKILGEYKGYPILESNWPEGLLKRWGN